MIRENWNDFKELLKATQAITKSNKLNEEAMLFMFQLLADYSFAEVQQGIKKHLKSDEGVFFPTVADIVRQIRGAESEREAAAWRLFLTAVNRFGYYDNVVFPLPAYHYAIEQMGGWEKVSNEFLELTDKERQFRRGEFIALFRLGERRASFNKQAGKVTVPRYLRGFYANDNSKRGYFDSVPQYAIDVITHNRIALEALPAPQEHGKKELPSATRVKITFDNIVGSLAGQKRLVANE